MKEDNLAYDLKNLGACDISPIDKSDDLNELSRLNVQFLVNKIFHLPRESTDVGPVIRLEKLDTVEHLPRKMPLPKPKVKSRWEKFAAERGIVKKKRSRLVWDESTKDWAPRWGANSAKHSQDKHDWLIEVPLNSTEDPYAQKSTAKQLESAKQKLREAQNKMESFGDKLPAGINTGGKRSKETLDQVLKRAQMSSSSHGRFDTKIKNEKTVNSQKRKKLLSNDLKSEKSQTMKIMNSVLKSSTSALPSSTDSRRKVIPIKALKVSKTPREIKKSKQMNRKRIR